MDSQKLSSDVTALLQAAGFGNLSSSFNDNDALVTGDLGTGGARFRWSARGVAEGAVESVGIGGPNRAAPSVEGAVAPSVPGTDGLNTSDLLSAIERVPPAAGY